MAVQGLGLEGFQDVIGLRRGCRVLGYTRLSRFGEDLVVTYYYVMALPHPEYWLNQGSNYNSTARLQQRGLKNKDLSGV